MNAYLMSPIGYTGYGYAGLNILKKAIKNNNIALNIIGNPNVENEEENDDTSIEVAVTEEDLDQDVFANADNFDLDFNNTEEDQNSLSDFF